MVDRSESFENSAKQESKGEHMATPWLCKEKQACGQELHASCALTA